VLILRVDAPIWFANTENLGDFIREKIARGQDEEGRFGEPIQYVILDLTAVSSERLRCSEPSAASPGMVPVSET
jgi:hypothetical protein